MHWPGLSSSDLFIQGRYLQSPNSFPGLKHVLFLGLFRYICCSAYPGGVVTATFPIVGSIAIMTHILSLPVAFVLYAPRMRVYGIRRTTCQLPGKFLHHTCQERVHVLTHNIQNSYLHKEQNVIPNIFTYFLCDGIYKMVFIFEIINLLYEPRHAKRVFSIAVT